MTLGTQVVSSVVARLATITIDGVNGQTLKHLMQFSQLIDIVFDFRHRFLDRRLNVDLNDVTRLVGDIDLAFATIAGVVDHQLVPTTGSPHGAIGTTRDQITRRMK
jgi:hypothetical protein